MRRGDAHRGAARPRRLWRGADYHDQAEGQWIDGQIATPMSRYPEYRATRSSFGLNVLGTVGVGVSTGGIPACFVAERHLARFVEGQPADRIELMWDQMWRSTLFYGRKGLALNAISAVDLALWDLLGKLRGEPVHALIGGAVRNEIEFYATGPGQTSPRRSRPESTRRVATAPACSSTWAAATSSSRTSAGAAG